MTYEDLPEERKRWLALSPIERFHESEKLLAQYIAAGGSLDPDYDPACPFYVPEDWLPGGCLGPADTRIPQPGADEGVGQNR